MVAPREERKEEEMRVESWTTGLLQVDTHVDPTVLLEKRREALCEIVVLVRVDRRFHEVHNLVPRPAFLADDATRWNRDKFTHPTIVFQLQDKEVAVLVLNL